MIKSTSFKTRARTIDHLGREQIADCPTAVSELWKNAYDAYARNVSLNIFDGDIPVAALVDNGYGMSREEFEDKWLTVGTESKASEAVISDEDRDGLAYRVRQGQKGIGRLSCASLGSLLLIVSKTKSTPFVAALIDWRLFENPFLMLDDIRIPMVEFDLKEELRELLPQMFDSLMGNIWGNGDDSSRDSRIELAWASFDSMEVDQSIKRKKESIEETVINSRFEDIHFGCWDVWTEESHKGTALFMSDIHDDLIAHLSLDSIEDSDSPDQRAKVRLIQTLSNFTDPFVSREEFEEAEGAKRVDFTTEVISHKGHLRRPIIDEVREFDLADLESLEHIVIGDVDEKGVFEGTIKLFGEWQERIKIKPAKLPKMRRDSRFGPFTLHIGSFEGTFSKSTLTKEQHNTYLEQAKIYGGFRVYRDGLRVMPYGREDNDYFEIEKRRSIRAGRHFWSNRRLFGRVAITREANPNLKDKAGREGIIDNRASKLFRDVIENILIETAKRFFGDESDTRKATIKNIQDEKAEQKAIEDRKTWLKKERKRVRGLIEKFAPRLRELVHELEFFVEEVAEGQHLKTEKESRELKGALSDRAAELKTFSLSPVPPNLGSIEDDYADYRSLEKKATELLNQLQATINDALEKHCPKSVGEIFETELQRNAAHLHSRIRKWANEGNKLLTEEIQRLGELVSECNKAYHFEMMPILSEVEEGRLELSLALKRLDDAFHIHDQKNGQLLQPYITAIQSIRDQIDLEGLASHNIKESIELRKEADRLNALAQLGITVEIIGHEIESLDMTIARGLKALPEDVKKMTAYQNAVFAHQGLSDRWRFLSPLKLSGEKTKVHITGKMILDYSKKFFGEKIEEAGIKLQATAGFLKFKIYEQPARIYPVFINLINNSRYWVQLDDAEEKLILLAVQSGNVIVADNGPGVEEEDLSQLFTLFFTRKLRGGRGVGLYLCKTNLQAGGHQIRYENIKERRLLPGANFAIDFQGGKYE